MSGYLKRIAAKIAAQKERIGILFVGYLGNAVMVYGFNFVLYPFVIWKLGILKGGAVMAILSFLVCYTALIFYDWAKKDWLGIEALKSVKEYKGGKRIGRMISWALQKSELLALVFLSIKYDPFITVVYLREGSGKYDGLSRRDWKIFLLSFAIGNIYWISTVSVGLEVLKHLWKGVF